jgi:DNA-binding SARP family transcriptional activator
MGVAVPFDRTSHTRVTDRHLAATEPRCAPGLRPSRFTLDSDPSHTGRPLIRLFGPLAIEHGERRIGPRDLGGARPKQVLQILLAARGHRVPVDRLAELLWAGEKPQNVTGSLQTFVSMLRRRLIADRDRARELVVTEPEAYRFATELVTLDLDRFDRLLEQSAREPTGLARASLEEALALVRGDVLEDEPYAPWALDLRSTYEGRVLGAHLDAADAALAERDLPPALAHAEASTLLDPFSERGHRTEMLALHAVGRSQEALARYRRFRMRLSDELGLEPGAETRALEAAIIRQDDVHDLLPRPIRRSPARARSGIGQLRLLGRTTELETLVGAVGDALAAGLALIQIEADPGLGKTRMLDELHRELGDVRVGRAACSELERHLPYVPLATALRTALSGTALDSGRLPALGHILPELALAAPPAHAGEVQILEALVALIAEHGPLVLLIDDIQWADERTLAALGYLRRRGAGVSAAIVTTAPAVETAPGRPLGSLTPDTVVRLESLSPADLAPVGTPELHEATAGNPRFLVEALANDLCAQCSETLTAALIAQCRAEGPSAYRMLLAASMLAQPFDPEPLADLLRTDSGELIEELERLCEQRILRIDGLRFRFRYDLVRQALAGSVSPVRQRLIRERLEDLATPRGSRSIRAIGLEAG